MNKKISFEEAYKRIEQILAEINEGMELEKSITLYEEASKLINLCKEILKNAEKKVDILIKSTDGKVVLDESEQPITKRFET